MDGWDAAALGRFLGEKWGFMLFPGCFLSTEWAEVAAHHGSDNDEPQYRVKEMEVMGGSRKLQTSSAAPGTPLDPRHCQSPPSPLASAALLDLAEYCWSVWKVN